MTDFPKYQKDWTIGTSMFHVRENDWDEFVVAVKNMEAIIPSNKPFPDDEGNFATSPEQAHNAPVCGNHNVPMKWNPPGISKKTGKAYTGFYGCMMKNQDGSFCTFRPK